MQISKKLRLLFGRKQQYIRNIIITQDETLYKLPEITRHVFDIFRQQLARFYFADIDN